VPGCPEHLDLFLLEAKKQDCHYAEVLQLEASLQDAYLQPQQGP
jgi:hypothetical protein